MQHRALEFYGRHPAPAHERVAVLAERDWDDEFHWAREAFNLPFRRFSPKDRQPALD